MDYHPDCSYTPEQHSPRRNRSNGPVPPKINAASTPKEPRRSCPLTTGRGSHIRFAVYDRSLISGSEADPPEALRRPWDSCVFLCGCVVSHQLRVLKMARTQVCSTCGETGVSLSPLEYPNLSIAECGLWITDWGKRLRKQARKRSRRWWDRERGRRVYRFPFYIGDFRRLGAHASLRASRGRQARRLVHHSHSLLITTHRSSFNC